MTDEEIQRAYQAARAVRRTHVQSNAPTPEELAALAGDELQGEARERLLERTLLSGRADDLALMHATATAANSVASESSIGRSFIGNRGWQLAAAAVLLVAVAIPASRWMARTPANDAERFRSASVNNAPTPVAPEANAELSQRASFVWKRMPEAQSYLLELIDVDGGVLASVTTLDSMATLPDSLSAAALSRAQGWRVTGTTVTGVQRRSGVRLFRERK